MLGLSMFHVGMGNVRGVGWVVGVIIIIIIIIILA